MSNKHKKQAQSSLVTYRPRRKRSGNPLPFQLTMRDLEMIEHVALYRFLNSVHLTRLVSGSAKNITRRLKGLFEQGYLDRPDCQYDFYKTGGGSSPLVYALADRGAQLLQGRGVCEGQTSWQGKNKSAGRPFLEHTLAIADFAIILQHDIDGRNGAEMKDGDDLVASFPIQTQSLAKPYRMAVPVIYQDERHNIGVEPDYAFSLTLSKTKSRALFLVEIDRGTMPVERKNLKQTSIMRKLLAYQTLWKAGQHKQHFGWKNFRVLFVTTSSQRVENMITITNSNFLTKDSPLFLFAEKGTLYKEGNILAHDWLGGDGKVQGLLPKSMP